MYKKHISKKSITLEKDVYDAMVQCLKVTSEYLQGKSKSFSSPEELIKHLEANDSQEHSCVR